MADSETQTHQFKVIGTRPIRHDGIDKVVGRAKYGADYTAPAMLHGKVLRSQYAHARIKSINARHALSLPGVRAVITHRDFAPLTGEVEYQYGGETTFDAYFYTLNLLAKEKVLYHGHPVAAVAATSPHIAEEALALIEVEYEELPPVLDLLEAMKGDAPILLAEVRDQDNPGKPTNVAGHFQFQRGDLDRGFKAANYIVEHEFNTVMVHQGYIEPHNALAIYQSDGHATVYCSTQGPFEIRMMCSKILGMDAGSIKVVPAEIGGGFGAKNYAYLEPLALLLSKKTGHPVRMVMTRTEVLRATGPTSGSKIKVKMGATRTGTITAAEVWMAFEAGAFPGSQVAVACITGLAPYAIPNFRVDGYDVLVNKPKTQPYRAPGAGNAAFAVESVIDELAGRCEIDPLDFRLKNAVREGSPTVPGPAFKRIGYVEVCEAIKNSEHYNSALTGKNRGRGAATGFWINTGWNPSS